MTGRSVRFVVTRGGVELYRRNVTTGSNGVAIAPLKSGYILPPAGEIKVLAELLDPTGQTVQSSASVTKTIAGVPVLITPVAPNQLVTRAGQAYAVTHPRVGHGVRHLRHRAVVPGHVQLPDERARARRSRRRAGRRRGR